MPDLKYSHKIKLAGGKEDEKEEFCVTYSGNHRRTAVCNRHVHVPGDGLEYDAPGNSDRYCRDSAAVGTDPALQRTDRIINVILKRDRR